MKKLLSILAAVGLTATASMAVIACSKGGVVSPDETTDNTITIKIDGSSKGRTINFKDAKDLQTQINKIIKDEIKDETITTIATNVDSTITTGKILKLNDFNKLVSGQQTWDQLSVNDKETNLKFVLTKEVKQEKEVFLSDSDKEIKVLKMGKISFSPIVHNKLFLKNATLEKDNKTIDLEGANFDQVKVEEVKITAASKTISGKFKINETDKNKATFILDNKLEVDTIVNIELSKEMKLENVNLKIFISVDKTKLEATIKKGSDIKNDDGKYTIESFKTLTDALTTATAVDKDEKATQEAVDKSASDIEAAITNLVTVGDKTELNKKIEEATKIKNDDGKYTTDSFKTLTDALAAANKVKDNTNADQTTVDKALKTLTDAIANLKEAPKAVDKTKLEAAIKKGSDIKNDDGKYTTDSFKTLTDTLAAGTTVDKDEKATQEAIDKSTSDIETAIANLKEAPKAVDKTKLEAAIKKGSDIKNDDGKYTTDSFKSLTDALTTATTVDKDEKATQEAIDKSTSDIEAAITNLKETPKAVDKTKLEAAIKKGSDIKNDDGKYTTDSFKTLTDTLAAATTVDKDEKATQEAIDKSTSDIETAITNLKEVPKTVDKSHLLKAIQKGSDIKNDDGKYTTESFESLTDALVAANKVNDDTNANQATVDAEVKTLTDAIANLKEAPKAVDKTKLEAAITEGSKLDNSKDTYTKDSFKTLTDALAAANKVKDDSKADQAAVDKATDAVNAAIKGLVKA